MPRHKAIREKIAKELGLPQDAMLALPRISMEGNSRVEVTGHKGIVAFSPIRIDIATNAGVLSVKGQQLAIDLIGLESAFISGIVSCVGFDME